MEQAEQSPPAPPAPSGQPPPAPGSSNRIDDYAGLPPGGWNAGIVMIGALVAFGAMLVGTIIVAVFDPSLETNAGRNASQLVVGLALGLTAVGFAASDAGGRIREALARLGVGPLALRMLGFAVLGWLAYVVAAAVLVPLLQPEQEDVTRALGTDEESALSVIVAGILIVGVAPLAEELFFRGFVFAGLRRSMPIWPAAVISALIWGSLHLTGGNVGVAIQLSVFGVILAYLYERTGSLWTPIIAHVINNSIAFTLLLTDVV